jgi:hypothetical protein
VPLLWGEIADDYDAGTAGTGKGRCVSTATTASIYSAVVIAVIYTVYASIASTSGPAKSSCCEAACPAAAAACIRNACTCN